MHQHVFDQLAFLVKALAAHVTTIGCSVFNLFIEAVGFWARWAFTFRSIFVKELLVPLHRFSRFKPMVTGQVRTFKRSFRYVNGLVHFQLRFMRESFLADLTFELIVRMNVFVSFQQIFIFVSVATYVAGETSFLAVRHLMSFHRKQILKGLAAN